MSELERQSLQLLELASPAVSRERVRLGYSVLMGSSIADQAFC